MTSKEKTQLICKLLSEKKGSQIVYIDVAEKTSLCDYFVICSGRSTTQVKSLGENLEEKLSKEYGEEPRRREGLREGRWAVLDYADVIVHIFNDEERDFYHLERLWENGNNLIHYED
jgi:ribosome-associated protein